MPVSAEIQEAGKRMLREEIARQGAHLSETQRTEAFATLLENERIKSALEYGSDVWHLTPAHVANLVRDGLADHANKFAPVPSAADYVAHKLPEMIKVFGEHARPDLMLSLYREAEAMSDTELIASGAKVGERDKVQELADANKPLHMRDYNWAGWDFEVSKRTGQHPANVLPSKRREIIDALKSESVKAANGGMHSKDVDALRVIDNRNPTTLSPEDRITAARLRAHN